MGAGEEADDGEDSGCFLSFRLVHVEGRVLPFAETGSTGKTGFCGEIVSFMSLVLGVLSLKDL